MKKKDVNPTYYLILPVIAVLIFLIFRFAPVTGIKEFYTFGISRKIIAVLSGINKYVSFSIAEAFIIPTVIVYVLSGVIMMIWYLIKGEGSKAGRRFFEMINVAAILFILFYVIWGFNYRFTGLRDMMSLENGYYTSEDLSHLSEILIQRAASEREDIDNSRYFMDKDGLFTLKVSADRLNDEINADYKRAGVIELEEPYIRLKTVALSDQMSYAGISGVFFPYTGEANVNVGQPALYIASSMAHEASHAKGIAREDEANFISFIVCTASEDPGIRYSGDMMALVYAMNRLKEDDMTEYRRLRDMYTAGMKKDLADYSSYWDRYNGPVSERVDRINDSYLKANMTSGVKDYEGVVALLLDLFRSKGEI